MMYGTMCKIAGNNDVTVAKMITAGFTGQLKGWWDNCLSNEAKTLIMNTKIDMPDNTQKDNAVYTLVVNIVEHFTGRYSDNNENIRTLLQNLRCKTLTDFRWYKDTFLSRVMELPEASSEHWKSKFIDGLPHLFAERVRNNLRNGYTSIPYDNYTYGSLIGTCIQEGLNLCNELKLNQQLKRQNLLEKNQLGEFCNQFGMDMPYPKKKKYNKQNFNNNPFYKRKRKKHHYSQAKLDKKAERKALRKSYKKNKSKKWENPLICYKCNKIGHIAKNCWTKKMISTLNVDDKIKDELYKIFLTDNELNSSSSSSDNEVKLIDEDSYLSDFSDITSSECEPCSQNKPCIKEENDLYNLISQFEDNHIHVLESHHWVEILQKIKDPEAR
ncbi:uncharacterized protein LOC141630534 [Silene latifolia]|uniref:uncharacterized protein LOC141630534 n=1 Tax=Silene latifolia TaxID=37657 RepID=UPI003D76DAD7